MLQMCLLLCVCLYSCLRVFVCVCDGVREFSLFSLGRLMYLVLLVVVLPALVLPAQEWKPLTRGPLHHLGTCSSQMSGFSTRETMRPFDTKHDVYHCSILETDMNWNSSRISSPWKFLSPLSEQFPSLPRLRIPEDTKYKALMGF